MGLMDFSVSLDETRRRAARCDEQRGSGVDQETVGGACDGGGLASQRGTNRVATGGAARVPSTTVQPGAGKGVAGALSATATHSAQWNLARGSSLAGETSCGAWNPDCPQMKLGIAAGVGRAAETSGQSAPNATAKAATSATKRRDLMRSILSMDLLAMTR